MDLSIFASPEAWISLVSLIFLEIVLGVDNLVFISITTNRLPEDKQHIGSAWPAPWSCESSSYVSRRSSCI